MTTWKFSDIRKKKIDYKIFDYANKNVTALYGLPKEIEFCKSCIVSNQRPNSTIEFKNNATKQKKSTITFDKDGICDACNVNALKNSTDWNQRRKELEELCDKYRKNNGDYDCIVPGSGGKDSAYAAWMLKYEFGMHPLTITWAPHIYTDWGRRNFDKWIEAGFDNQLYTPNGKVHRILTRIAVENLFHPFQPFIIGQKMLAPKLAKLLNIPLVFFGESEAEYGNPVVESDNPVRETNFHNSSSKEKIYLAGMEADKILKGFNLNKNDFKMYMPDTNQNYNSKIDIRYLGYYLKWHPMECYYHSVENFDFQPAPYRNPGSYLEYDSIDDKIDDLHYYTTFIKFGIGRATQDAAQQVRNGDIDRYEAVNLIKKYDGEYPKRFMPELMEYLSLPEREFPGAANFFEVPIIDEEYFKKLSDSFRSPHLWYYNKSGWHLRKAAWHEK